MRLIDEKTLDRFRGVECEWCHRNLGECHHIFAKGMGGSGRVDHQFNLLSVCRVDHAHIHNGAIPRTALLEIVAKREGVTPEIIRTVVAMIRRLPKGSPLPDILAIPAIEPEREKPRLIEVDGVSYVFVRAVPYRVVPLQVDRGVVRAAWRLEKSDDVSYVVHVDEWGFSCDCPSGVYRRRCKHAAALMELNLERQ